MRRQWLQLVKSDDMKMKSWISVVETYAQRLTAAGVTVTDEDKIVVLVNGLSASYESLVVSLDSVDADKLTLDYVKQRLLNESVRQKGPVSLGPELDHMVENLTIKGESTEERTALTAKYKSWKDGNENKEGNRSAPSQSPSEPKCYRCGVRSHVARDCRTALSGDRPLQTIRGDTVHLAKQELFQDFVNDGDSDTEYTIF
jgi:hypothetical protein